MLKGKNTFNTKAMEKGKVPWTARDAWWALLSALVLEMVFGFALGFIFAALDIGWIITLNTVAAISPLLWLIPVWFFGLRKYGVSIRSLGFRSFTGKSVGIGCALLIALYVLGVVYSVVLTEVFDINTESEIITEAEEASFPLILTVAIVFLAPVGEEIFFRGFIFKGLCNKYSWKRAAVISSAIFGIIHLQLVAIPLMFVLGYVLAYMYHRANSLWPSIIMHATWNGVIMAFAYIASNADTA